MPEKAFENVENVLDSELRRFKQEKSFQLIIVVGPSDKKKNVLQRFIQTVKKSKLKVVYTILKDLSEAKIEFNGDIIILDELEYYLFQPTLQRHALTSKLKKFFDEIEHMPAKLLILGVNSNSALRYFIRKFERFCSQAKIVEIK